MGTSTLMFSKIIDSIYDLPLEDRLEIRNLLDRNIADSRRKEIEDNFKQSKKEEQAGNLLFSSNIDELKKML
jgi:hypothetical protein